MIITTTGRTKPPAGTTLHVAGELDTVAADRLGEDLRLAGTAPAGAVVVDLSGVTFMSCSALRVLVEARARLGTRLFVDGRSRVVARLLAITGLGGLFAGLEDDDPVLRRARDLLVAVHGCTAQEAGQMLRGAAGTYGVPVEELARLLVRVRRADEQAPGPAAAVATLALLMRRPAGPLEDDVRPRFAASGVHHRPVARLAGL